MKKGEMVGAYSAVERRILGQDESGEGDEILKVEWVLGSLYFRGAISTTTFFEISDKIKR